MDNKLRMDDRESVASATTGSGYTGALSDLSALENETDDFGRRILQHQRAIRVRTSTTTTTASSRQQQAFSRARPRKSEPVSLETEQNDIRPLHRRTASDGSALASTTTTTNANPPLNVPREWGRRARRRPDWLRSYESEGGALGAVADVNMDEDSILPHRTAYTGDESPIMQWSPSGDVVMPSIELTPTGKRSRGATSPWSLRHMNTTLPLDSSVIEQNEQGQQDLTDASSLLASTPAINLRNRKVDLLMRYDVDKRRENEKRASSLSHISERSYESSSRPVTAPAVAEAVSRRRRSGASASDKENEPARKVDIDAKDAPVVGFKSTRTYSHAREDSMALLRKLARVTSMSPSPAREAERMESQRESRFSSRDEPKLKQEGSSRSRSDRAAAEAKEERQIKRESDRPKSALEEVLRENRKGKNQDKALPLGESTLVSLENIVSPDFDGPSASAEEKTRSKHARTIKNEPASETADIGSMTPGEKARRQEDLALAKLNNTLQSTRTTIKDANNGLRRIENKIEAASWSSSASRPDPSSASAKPHSKPSKASDDLCTTCTSALIRSYTSTWSSLFREFLSLFILPSSSPPSLLGYRFTWLGVMSLLIARWYTTETTLCSYYCHQPYATSMDGYGVDPDAPDFPFVIPTLLFRPWRSTWQPMTDYLVLAAGAVYSVILGGGGADATLSGSTMGKGKGYSRRPLHARRQVAAAAADIGGARGTTAPVISEAVKMTTSSTARGWFAAAAKATQAAVAPSSIVHAVRQAGSRWEESFLPGE